MQDANQASTASAPAAVFGVPLFDGGEHVEDALRSLFRQTYRRAAFVLVDDGSTDGSFERAEKLVAAEPRAELVRNERRLGLVANWQRAFALARDRHPEARYFAWASDHDVWEPTWLETLVGVLDADPGAVLAYPLTARIAAGELHVRKGPRLLDTGGVDRPLRRFAATVADLQAGNMVYGLYRAEALALTGGMRPVLAPDRLLLLELSLQGGFRQVREVLWHRRHAHRVGAARQRRTLFPGRAPRHAYLPESVVHTVALARTAGAGSSRATVLAAAAAYPPLRLRRTLLDAARRAERRSRPLRRRLRRVAAP